MGNNNATIRTCENCDESFEIYSTSEEKPQFCPFCGEYLEEVDDDEDDLYEED